MSKESRADRSGGKRSDAVRRPRDQTWVELRKLEFSGRKAPVRRGLALISQSCGEGNAPYRIPLGVS